MKKMWIFLSVFLGAFAMHIISRQMLFQHWAQRTCVASVDVTKNLFSNLVWHSMRPFCVQRCVCEFRCGARKRISPFYVIAKESLSFRICVNEFRIHTTWLWASALWARVVRTSAPDRNAVKTRRTRNKDSEHRKWVTYATWKKAENERSNSVQCTSRS